MEQCETVAVAAAPAGLKAGQILVSTWGYNMTNVDFYEVIKSAAPGKMTELVKVKSEERATGFLCGTSTPVMPLVSVGQSFAKKVNKYGEVKLTSYSSAAPWSGNPMHYNHCD